MVNREGEMTPLPAATVTLVRDSARGLEVLLLQRSFASGFMPGVHVFPGGGLDEADASAELHALCAGPDDAQASRTLGVERGGLAYWIAGIRESFEEAGILLAYDASGEIVTLTGAAGPRFLAHRHAQGKGHAGFAEMVKSENLRLAADRLVYFGHWITPVGAPRRYDTRFFLAVSPPEQEAVHDNREAIAHVWVRPAEALERYGRSEIKMRTPTLKTLELFADYASAAALVAALSTAREVTEILPRVGRDGRTLLPGDPGYDEAGRAGGRGQWKV
jgi:8-oxo-dGTP pyrophosphatase MutT (NUDIX family)